MRGSRAFLCLWMTVAGSLLAGCAGSTGYSNASLFPDDVGSVYLEMLDNSSFRRGIEYTVSDALAKRIEMETPYKLVSSRDRADSIMSGRLVTAGDSILTLERDVGRALEKEADLAGYTFAQAAGYDARLAVTALSKLGEHPESHPWIVNIYGTHPLMTSREDRLAAFGDEEPEGIEIPPASPRHTRDLAQGLKPLDPKARIAVRILAPGGGRWENSWRKNFTKRLHLRLTPLGFAIAGDDLMYKPDIGDPVEAARSRQADYLLLVTVGEMSSTETGEADLAGTPVRAAVEVEVELLAVSDGSRLWAGRFREEGEGRDVLAVDAEILHADTCLGGLVEKVAAEIAYGCATAAGAEPAQGDEEAPPSAE